MLPQSPKYCTYLCTFFDFFSEEIEWSRKYYLGLYLSLPKRLSSSYFQSPLFFYLNPSLLGTIQYWGLRFKTQCMKQILDLHLKFFTLTMLFNEMLLIQNFPIYIVSFLRFWYEVCIYFTPFLKTISMFLRKF